MIDNVAYILFFGVLISIIVYLYIRLKFGFWAIQPVFHIYDVGYMLKAPGIINDHLPERNKYTNFKDIETLEYSKLTNLQIQRLTNFIRVNYLKKGDNVFIPGIENITPYFNGHNTKSYISFYYGDNLMLDTKSQALIPDKKIIGSISSRPINIVINNGNKAANFMAYYVDYLCVDMVNRKKGIAPKLIQTHHYNQRRLNKPIVVSLFKREEELTGIVPLCVYSTYGFRVEKWHKPLDLPAEYKLLEINGQNYHFLLDFIKDNNDEFDIIINSEVTNYIELIKTHNIFIYATLCDDKIICAYFFRKSCVQIEKGLEVLTCFASINNTDDNIFIQGFKISFWKISAEKYFGFSAIENISHNDVIINNIIQKTDPILKSPTAYFFYNFAYPTFKANRVLIIN